MHSALQLFLYILKEVLNLTPEQNCARAELLFEA